MNATLRATPLYEGWSRSRVPWFSSLSFICNFLGKWAAVRFLLFLRRLHRSSHLATYNKSLLFQLFHLRVHTNHHVNGLQFLSWIQCWLKHRSLSSVTRSLPFHFIYPCCNSGPYLLDWARRLQYAVEWNTTLIKALKLATYNNKPTILVSRD